MVLKFEICSRGIVQPPITSSPSRDIWCLSMKSSRVDIFTWYSLLYQIKYWQINLYLPIPSRWSFQVRCMLISGNLRRQSNPSHNAVVSLWHTSIPPFANFCSFDIAAFYPRQCQHSPFSHPLFYTCTDFKINLFITCAPLDLLLIHPTTTT